MASIFGYNSPKKATEKTKGTGLDGFTIAQLATDIGGPIAYELFTAPERRRAREEAKVSLTIPEIMAGQVRDLPRPSFGLPETEPAGSSLAENILREEFRNAFQRQNIANFETQNEASKLQQEDRVRTNLNRAAEVEANIKNQEQIVNSQIPGREYLMRLADQGSTFESLFANTSKDLGQLAFLTDAKKIAAARDILTNPDAYDLEKDESGKIIDPRYEQARRVIWGMLRKGGKVKKRKTKFSY